MKGDVDAIVATLPPPEEMEAGGEGGAPTEYSAEEDAAVEVARAMGMDPEKVDVPALCQAMKQFIKIASTEE